MVDNNENFDYVDRAKEEMSLFEKITSYIPGYRGYSKHEKIRSTDKIVRENVARLLNESYGNMTEVFELMVSDSEEIVSVDKINLKLDALEQRIAHAESGYSSFFDPIKVGEGALERMVELDATLLDQARSILSKTSDLKIATMNNADTTDIIMEITNLISELDMTFSDRRNYMLELPR